MPHGNQKRPKSASKNLIISVCINQYVSIIRELSAFFGELSLLLDQPHSASVEAVEETKCFITRGGKDFLEAHLKIALAVAELLAARLNGMIGCLADLKAQYEDRKDHLGMVDALLLNIAHRTPKITGHDEQVEVLQLRAHPVELAQGVMKMGDSENTHGKE